MPHFASNDPGQVCVVAAGTSVRGRAQLPRLGAPGVARAPCFFSCGMRIFSTICSSTETTTAASRASRNLGPSGWAGAGGVRQEACVECGSGDSGGGGSSDNQTAALT